MSAKPRSGGRIKAAQFAALGDETRLLLLARLASGEHCSIASLTEGTALTRQAATKHLRVLERVRMVHRTREGRESLFRFDPKPVVEAKEYLELVSRQWDAALLRLKAFVEGTPQGLEGSGLSRTDSMEEPNSDTLPVRDMAPLKPKAFGVKLLA